MSAISRQMHPIQVRPLFVTKCVVSAPKSTELQLQPAIVASRQSVKRKLFDIGDGSNESDDINQMLKKENDRNAALLLNRYNFDLRAVDAAEKEKAKAIAPSATSNKLTCTSRSFSEMHSLPKRIAEVHSPTDKESTFRFVGEGKLPNKCNTENQCNASNANSSVRSAPASACSRQQLLTECYNVRKNTQSKCFKSEASRKAKSVPDDSAVAPLLHHIPSAPTTTTTTPPTENETCESALDLS